MVTITKIVVAAFALGAVQALPQLQSAQPSAAPTAPAAPPAAEDQAQLFRDLFTAPTAIKRFQRLLTQGQTLFTGETLRKLTVFSFNNAEPAVGAKGGATKAAVSYNKPPIS
jgi:hypothetical protein